MLRPQRRSQKARVEDMDAGRRVRKGEQENDPKLVPAVVVVESRCRRSYGRALQEMAEYTLRSTKSSTKDQHRKIKSSAIAK